MKEFKTAAKAKKRRDNGEHPIEIEFKLDDREMKAKAPKDASFIMLAASADDDNPAASAIEMMRFLDNCLEKSDRDHISKRLRDPDDLFDFDDVVSLFEYIVEEISARPTESSPDS